MTCSRGVVLVPDAELEAVVGEPFDLVVLPGGAGGAERLAADERLQALLRRHRDGDGWTAAICAAPGVLAAWGMLEGRRATGFPGTLEVHGIDSSNGAVEVDGRVVTSRGPGTAMEFALELIERIDGRETRDRVETRLQR